jgi:hypothetical protein
VLNNFGDGMVKQWQKLFFKGRLSASDKSLHKKDFIKAAQADGFPYAVRLDRKADVPRVIEEFIRYPGPAFLEVIIDPDAGRVSDGRPGPGLRRDDHRRSHRLAIRSKRRYGWRSTRSAGSGPSVVPSGSGAKRLSSTRRPTV